MQNENKYIESNAAVNGDAHKNHLAAKKINTNINSINTEKELLL